MPSSIPSAEPASFAVMTHPHDGFVWHDGHGVALVSMAGVTWPAV
jgi:hypothetical protein